MGGTLTLDGKGSSNSVIYIKIKGLFNVILTRWSYFIEIFWIIDGGLDVAHLVNPREFHLFSRGCGNNCITQGILTPQDYEKCVATFYCCLFESSYSFRLQPQDLHGKG
jgi:hypothetical protein